MNKTIADIKEDFTRFLYDEVGSSGRGTVSTYIRAIDVLEEALRLTGGHPPFQANVWAIESPAMLLSLHRFVTEQQHAYVNGKTGVFAALTVGGRSYYERRWCSAAVRHLAAYRQTRQYEDSLQSVFANSSEGTEVAVKAKNIRLPHAVCFVPENVDPSSKEGKEAVSLAKRRINQNIFRSWIVGIYRNECCVTGLNIPEILRASHIVSWAKDVSNRMNPANGLCLSATYDAAFDRHLISFDENYRMILSKRIKEFCTHAVCAEYFKRFEGVKMRMPSRFFPDQNLLAKHREALIAG